MTMQDAQEKEDYRRMIIGNYSMRGLSKMTWIDFVLEGATNLADWRAAMAEDLVANIEPIPCRRSTFLAKREC